MPKVSQMVGVPWHVETLHMSEDDSPRHCHRCVYYIKGTRKCEVINGNCFGSAHCEYYSEIRPLTNNKFINATVKLVHKYNVNEIKAKEIKSEIVDENNTINQSNFLFMKDLCPSVANFGAQAEKYVNDDPNTTLFKIGQIAEIIVKEILKNEGIQYNSEDKQIDLIQDLKNEDLIRSDIESILTSIRIGRNKATHEGYNSEKTARLFLEYAFILCRWYMENYGPNDFILPEYTNFASDNSYQINNQKVNINKNENIREDYIIDDKSQIPEEYINAIEEGLSLEDGVIIQIKDLALIDSTNKCNIKEIYIENDTNYNIENLVLEIISRPNICMPIKLPIESIKAKSGYSLRDISLNINEEYLNQITYDTNCYLTISLKYNNKLIAYEYVDVEMESSSIYTIAHRRYFRAATICAAAANLYTGMENLLMK